MVVLQPSDLSDRSSFHRMLLNRFPFQSASLADSRCFSSFTQSMKQPYDERITRAMVETTKYLVEGTHARIGYAQSDEISLVWQQDRSDSEVFFNGKIHKLTSVLAALAPVKFDHACLADDTLRERAQKLMPVFDCRVFQLPNRTVRARRITLSLTALQASSADRQGQ